MSPQGNIILRLINNRVNIRTIYVFLGCLLISSGWKLNSQNIGAELLSSETNIVIRNGKLYKNVALEIRIKDRSGEEFTNLNIPYSKIISLIKVEACIRDKNGEIVRKLENRDITDKSFIPSGTFYSDDFAKEFTMKHNVYPYTIIVNYQLQQDEFYQIENWIPVLDSRVPTDHAMLSIEVPANYKINYSSLWVDSSKLEKTDLGMKYLWYSSYSKPLKPEFYAPSIMQFLPKVTVCPEHFFYNQTGSFASWISFGEWNNKLLSGLSDLPLDEISKVKGLITNIPDAKGKVQVLYNFVQDNTRYIDVSIETGGLKPYPASYVAQNKYGDCKALTNYIRALLEVAGIESFYTLIKAGGPKTIIDKDFPSQQFNHAILCVPDGKDTIWLDAASASPFNYTGTFIQDRDACIITKNSTHFTRTPALTLRDVKNVLKAEFFCNDFSKVQAKFTNYCRGELYEKLKSIIHLVDNGKKEELFANNFIGKGYRLIDLQLSDPVRDSACVNYSYSALAFGKYKFYGNDLIVEVLPFSIPEMEKPEIRKLPVQIDYPVYMSDTLIYHIPGDYKVINLPVDNKLDSKFGKYEIISQIKDGTIIIIKTYWLFKGEVQPDSYPDFYHFLNNVRTSELNARIYANNNY
jgi:hypothetical protein